MDDSEVLKACLSATNEIRALQRPSGAIDSADRHRAADSVATLTALLTRLDREFPSRRHHLAIAAQELSEWATDDFGVPNFSKTLDSFEPHIDRRDAAGLVAFFPMYTPNASRDIRFELVAFSSRWPSWLKEVHQGHYQRNAAFVPARLVYYSDGYNSECAVLFPDAVSVSGRPQGNFGIIFCDREAKRFRRLIPKALSLFNTTVPGELADFLSDAALIEDVFALWDLIHDSSHMTGELPFDPFMVRRRAPFWMYGLEELRVDLQSCVDAAALTTHVEAAKYVHYAVVLDRIFRFAVTGSRVRNYDSLAGQILFNYLHNVRVIEWRDGVLSIAWDRVVPAVADLLDRIRAVYRRGQVISRPALWCMAHDLVSEFVAANLASKWVRGIRTFSGEEEPRELIGRVLDDEFPLGVVQDFLRSKMQSENW